MIVRAPRDLGLLVREARRSQRLTQAHLAAKAGVSRDWVSALERGNSGAEFGRVLRTVNALELRLDVSPGSTPSPRAKASAARLDDIVANARTPSP